MVRRAFFLIVRAFLVLGVLAGLSAQAEESTVVTETTLRPAPDAGEISAFLTAETPVEVVERRDDWVRVRVEGWVRANAVAGPPASAEPAVPPMVPVSPSPEPATPAPAPVTPPPAPVTAPRPAQTTVPAGAAVEGLIDIKLKAWRGLKQKKVSSAGMPVMLLPGVVDLASTDAESSETAERLAELDAKAARLEKEAKAAMRKSNFTEATLARDELLGERQAVLAERLDLLAAEHGRHEQAARATALATTVADARGWYTVAPVAPGTYTLYARLTGEDVDVEWVETLTVSGASVRIDLDESKAHGLPPE
jgi:hypothetical protein